jgi:CheY-like chemotaxis protein
MVEDARVDVDARTDGRRILVIDDDPAVARAIASCLDDFGYRCTIATSGTDGLARFGAGAFDCVVIDLTMPRPGGLEVIRQMRAARPDLPVVLMSGYAAAEAKLVSGGVTAFLHKPFADEELVAAVREVAPSADHPTA